MIYKTMTGRRALLLVLIFALAMALTLWALSALGVDAALSAASSRLTPIYSVETPRAAVSLGINCAWGDEDIPAILAALEKYGVKATFFVVGEWCSRCPEALAAIHAAGHELGSHSDTHPDMSRLDEAAIRAELDGCAEKLKAATGERPSLFRPPSGAYGDTLIRTAKSMGYYVVQWSLDSIDWKGLSAQEIYERIVPKAENGDILLLHSGAKHTAEALPDILEGLVARGFDVIPVSELIYHENYSIDHTGRQHPAA